MGQSFVLIYFYTSPHGLAHKYFAMLLKASTEDTTMYLSIIHVLLADIYMFFFFQTSAFLWNRERKSSRLWRDNVSSHHLPPVSPFLFPSHRRPLSVVELNEHEPRFPPKITTPRPFRLWASPTETFHLAYYPLSCISLFPNKLMGSWNKVIKLWKKKKQDTLPLQPAMVPEQGQDESLSQYSWFQAFLTVLL